MEYDKTNNLLDRPRNRLSKFVTKNWVKVNRLRGGNYDPKKQIRYKTPMLRSDLCNYSDAYVLVKGTITVTAPAEADNIRDKKNRPLVLKNNAPFISCISKINDELIENAEDLDVVMPMCNLLEYSKNYKKTTGSLFNYYRDELSDDASNLNSPNIQVINSEPFRYKTSITGNTYNVADNVPGYDAAKEGKKNPEIIVPLKYLGNFWRNLDMPLINCEVSLTLTWDKNCMITSLERRVIVGAVPAARDNSPTGATFARTDCKFCVPVVTLSKNNDNELLSHLKSGFKRVITWNKYLLQVSDQSINNNLNFLIDLTFNDVNRLLVLSFENDNANANNRTSFPRYYL